MSGFTGLNIERAVYDIKELHDIGWDIQEKVRMPLKYFFIYLEKHWASPVAKQFSDEVCAVWQELDSEYMTSFLHILQGAEDAARALAQSNGAYFPCHYGLESGYVHNGDPIVIHIKEDIDGIVGMDVEGVRIALEAFKDQEKEGIALFDDLPEYIAFYDPEGELLGTYGRNVKNFKTKFEKIINTINEKMESYLETETDNILMAKQNAADTLNA